MSEPRRTDQSGAYAEWTVRLECGHDIALPWGSREPALAACIVEHRHRCETPSLDLSGVAWWAAPVGRSPVVPSVTFG